MKNEVGQYLPLSRYAMKMLGIGFCVLYEFLYCPAKIRKRLPTIDQIVLSISEYEISLKLY